ncbi:hypothetical protein AAFF_G00336240 [Aldrovandia affinis]|uniref:Uncharacterized protein n=1 Tax=Aldrovandia affinis TaxID=143900 RepID=A0AAD7R664_9TELE|nr:hypothetical protein AAFF_G00336240 [Aldrovandia affinis]
MEIYPLPPSESTTYTCTAKNPVSRATSDPIDLGVCSIQQPRGGRWVPALCGLLALFLIGLLIFLYKRNQPTIKHQPAPPCPQDQAPHHGGSGLLLDRTSPV